MPPNSPGNSHTQGRLTQDIVGKLWNLCNVLKDDGVTYHQYVTELTYLLFLKMAKETGQEQGIPEEWRWDALETLDGPKQMKHYQLLLLLELGSSESGSSFFLFHPYKNRRRSFPALRTSSPSPTNSKPASPPPARWSIASPQRCWPRPSAASWCPRIPAMNRRVFCWNGSGRPARRKLLQKKPSRRGRPKAAANPASSPVVAAPVTPDRLASLLRECGALSERALRAASELDPASFQVQLAHERSLGAIGNVVDDGQELLGALG